MQLHDLPDDVLRPVLKANLPLLAVCRRWRRLALTTVYSGVAICYDSRASRDSGPDDGHHPDNMADEPDDPAITTNLDLVVSAGCVQAVKRAQIVVDHKTNPLPGLGAAIRLMRAAAAGEWRGVRRLDISTMSAERTLALGVNAADYESEIKQTSAALAAILPGVCNVTFKDYFASPVVRELDGQLAVLYSDQLEGLLSYHTITVPPDHTFRQLKSVSIGHDSSISYQHPRVDPAKLVSLSLTLWPSDHSWAPFSADGDSGVIEFPNLRRLGVAYWITTRTADGVEARHPDGHPWRLHFPKLDRLLASRSTTMLVAANRILESARESKEKALVVYDESMPVLPETITCTSLTALDIWAEASVDTMLGLIRKLLSLAKLHIWSLTLRNIQEDISVPGPDEDCLVEPFNTNIKEMLIQLVPVVKEPIAEFVDAYSKRYPHLAGVKLCDND
ncbi:hypothetical protein H4R18_005554 [Coemansia javaensis]|uniref:F-box domain-containing protein n=1 Tax=Coemansia javaensis TaxID=2761396 RepID=A0A9W8H873_9FUNG|nr:hypothetical protein H4R18_005554 [Coemansia javaensis]